MEKVKFTKPQQIVVDEFKLNSYLRNNFYFTGGTALSVYYFGHRESEDLDFFTEQDLPKELVQQFVSKTASKHKLKFNLREIEGFNNILVYNIDFGKLGEVKIDFNSYPYPQVEKRQLTDGMKIDSLLDIGTNKLQTITQRTEVKDYVDLYFLLQKFTIWDLMYGVETKFKMKIDPVLIGEVYMKIEDFTVLPKMLVPLTLPQLQRFFKRQSRQLAKSFTK